MTPEGYITPEDLQDGPALEPFQDVYTVVITLNDGEIWAANYGPEVITYTVFKDRVSPAHEIWEGSWKSSKIKYISPEARAAKIEKNRKELEKELELELKL